MLEKKLLEEVQRYKKIYKYAENLIMEQGTPAPEETTTPPPPSATDTASGAETPPADPTLTDTPPPPDTSAVATDDTQEIDITDLVNMTTSIKKDLESHSQDNGTAIAKMDDLFNKLGDLEHKLSQMDTVIAKIDQLDVKMDSIKEKTPQEKLEMRSLDSYPFNQNPQEFFAKKQDDMRNSGKNEYVLTKDDIQNYSNDGIRKSFNPDEQEDDAKY